MEGLVDKGALRYQDGEWRLDWGGLDEAVFRQTMVPSTAVQAIESNLKTLDDELLAVARAAAVLGRSFDFEVLLRLLELPGQVLLDRLERLQARRVLSGKGARAGSLFSFYHELIRRVLLDSLPLGERRRIHAQAAVALEELFPDRPFDLARHFLAAGLPQRAGVHLVQAAQDSYAAFDHRQSIEYYRSALEVPQISSVFTRLMLLERLADAYRGSGNPSAAIATLEEIVDQAPCANDRARLLRKLGRTLCELGRYEEARQRLSEGLHALGVRRLSGGPLGTAQLGLRLFQMSVPVVGAALTPKDEARAAEVQALRDRLAPVFAFLRPPGWEGELLNVTAQSLTAAFAVGEQKLSPQAWMVLGTLFLHGWRPTRWLGPWALKRAAVGARGLPETRVGATALREIAYLLHESGEPQTASVLAHQADEYLARQDDSLG